MTTASMATTVVTTASTTITTSMVNSTLHTADTQKYVDGMGMGTMNIVCLSLIIVMGIACNVSAIIFIVRKDSDMTLKDKIVAVLCAINSCQTIGYSIELHAAILGEVTGGSCRAAAFIICGLTYSSIGYFVELTIERYLAILHPFKYVAWFTDDRNTKWLFLPPILGFALAVAPLAGWSHYGKAREHSTYCGFDFRDNSIAAKSYFVLVVFIIFGIPLLMTSICFAGILMELRRAALETKRKYGKSSDISRASAHTIKEQSVSCLLTGFVYCASWIPYTIVCFKFYFEAEVSTAFEYVAIYMSKSAIISSPVIYCLIERRFRAFVKDQLSSQLQPMVARLSVNA